MWSMSIEPFPGDCGVLEAGCASSFPCGATAGTRGLGRRGGGSREHSVLLSAFHIKTRNNPYFFTSNFFIFIIQFCQAGVLVSAAITNCHKLDGLKNTEIYSQTVLEARSLNSGMSWAVLPRTPPQSHSESSWGSPSGRPPGPRPPCALDASLWSLPPCLPFHHLGQDSQ